MDRLTLKPGERVKLRDWDPSDAGGYKDSGEAKAELIDVQKRMAELQEVFYASSKKALLVILQAMDAGGKDGTIRRVMAGVNPAGCTVTSFKVPTADELAHGFLWRVHKAIPARGQIGIFNRSHYEDVLVVRVLKLVPKEVWKARFDQINAFEKILSENGVVILKFFLHISKDEQAERFRERLADPTKIWKFNPGDLDMRERWDEFMNAYEDVLEKCTTEHAPWTVVPADRKWHRNLVVAKKIVKTLESLNLEYPDPPPGLEKVVVR
ncbi:MAG: polyphosphate kinase 2 family protein [Acidobacteria bacterium]|nr:polyphosphate kinase 2 family protein [Acidobacteriota bacterium]